MQEPAHDDALVLFDRLRRDPEILASIERADSVLGALGYTDHGRRHVTLVGVNAARVLASLGFDGRAPDLAAVAGLLHDIGNVEGRDGHAAAGAELAHRLLVERDVPEDEADAIKIAIANHDEVEGGVAQTVTSAALIIADKADIHRSRVRTRNPQDFDVHDRVNYAVVRSGLDVLPHEKQIALRLVVDHAVAKSEEIAELFGSRFALAASAADYLGSTFAVEMNGKELR